jgi:hypothetical protein
VGRIAKVDSVDLEEAGQKPAKKCNRAWVLDPEVEPEK